MEKIVFLIGFLVILASNIQAQNTSKNLVIYPDKIEIEDTSQVDTLDAVYSITYWGIKSVKIGPEEAEGSGVLIAYNAEDGSRYTKLLDIQLHYREFNDYDNNQELYDVVNDAYTAAKDWSGYTKKFHYTSNVLDTIHYVLNATDDTVFYKWIDNSSGNIDSIGWVQY